jgi:hypothetical protein
MAADTVYEHDNATHAALLPERKYDQNELSIDQHH